MSQPLETAQRGHRRAFTLVELLIVVAIIGILIAILMPALNSVRESGRRMTCSNNLRSLGQALHSYHSSFLVFPPALEYDETAGPLEFANQTNNFGVNWVIEILQFMEREEVRSAFDLTLAISHSDNAAARATVIGTMLCPSDINNRNPYNGGINEGDNWARGNYAANGGAGTLSEAAFLAIPGASGKEWNNLNYQGVMGPNASLRLDDIRDGSTKTILVGEIRSGANSTDRRGTWAMGTGGASSIWGYAYGGDDNGPNFSGSATADDIKSCGPTAFMLEAGMPCHPGLPSQQATVRSMHLDGVQVVMASGSVHFITDFIDTTPFGINVPTSVWDGLVLSNDRLRIDDSAWNLDY